MPSPNKESENAFEGFVSDSYRDGVLVQPVADADAGAKDDGSAGSGDAEPAKDEESAVASEESSDADASGEGGDAPEEQEKPKEKPKKTVQERIGELTHARREAERQVAEERRQRAALEERLAALERGEAVPRRGDLTHPKKQDNIPNADGKPDPDKYEFGQLDERYIADVTAYHAEQAHRNIRQREAAEREAQERATTTKAVCERGEVEFEDFREKVIEPVVKGQVSIPDVLFDMVLSSEVGEKILYHLMTDTEGRKVLSAPLHKQAAAFGRLEARFAAAKPEELKPTTPTQPLKLQPAPKQPRGAGGRFSVGPDTNDFSAFEAMATTNQRS